MNRLNLDEDAVDSPSDTLPRRTAAFKLKPGFNRGLTGLSPQVFCALRDFLLSYEPLTP
jgi:hypothetical protein